MTGSPSDPDPNVPNPVQGYIVQMPNEQSNDDIDLLELLRYLTRYKLMMFSIIVATTAIAVVLSLIIKPVYRSEILLASAMTEETQGNLAALAGQFGGLASLAGINIGGTDNTDEAIAILKSRSFTEEFILNKELIPILFSKKWDADSKSWNVDDPSEIPTPEDAYRLFDEEIRKVNVDSDSGLIVLAIEWKDRVLAANWANDLVERLNLYLRHRDIAEAERSIEFLNAELDKNSVIELQQGIFRLIEHQVETIMLANVREEYAFRILDPAVASDEDNFIWPKRMLMVLIAFIIGGVLALSATVLRNELRLER
jgi:uncharacterized protein involved in exopolysaccharide biosynthesis